MAETEMQLRSIELEDEIETSEMQPIAVGKVTSQIEANEEQTLDMGYDKVVYISRMRGYNIR